MLNEAPHDNELMLLRMSKITNMNPGTAVGRIIDTTIYDNKSVGEWFIIGYFRKLGVLLIVPSRLNTKEINDTFEENVISRESSGALKIHMNLINNQNLIFQDFEYEQCVYSLYREAKLLLDIKIAGLLIFTPCWMQGVFLA